MYPEVYFAKIKQEIKRALGVFYYPSFKINKIFDNKPKFIILVYHSIHPRHPWSISPNKFEEQIKFISSNYPILSLGDFFNFKENSISITFDDGYEDNFYYALPILKKYNLNATFFICSGFITKEIDIAKDGPYKGLRPLTIEMIKEMKKEGMNFGSHTHAHPILSKVSLSQAKEDIHKSKIILESILEEKINLFAYPFGQLNTFNDNIISVLKEEGFQLSCSTIWGNNNKHTNPFILRRIRIDPMDTLRDFKDKIEGKWDFIKWFHYLKWIT